MTIESKKNAGKLTLTITGRLDTSTAPKLEEELKASYDGVTELVFDLAKPDPNVILSAKERKIGGLGIFMTKKFMDDLSYEYRDGQNVFSMKKNL